MYQGVTVKCELEKVLHKFSGNEQLCKYSQEELINNRSDFKHKSLQSHRLKEHLAKITQ